MEYFIAQARIILPVLGCRNILPFDSGCRQPRRRVGVGFRGHLLTSLRTALEEGRDFRSRQEIDGELTVLEGSGAREAWTGVSTHTRSCARSSVQEGRSFRADNCRAMATPPATRCSPALAPAAVVLGQPPTGATIEGTRFGCQLRRLASPRHEQAPRNGPLSSKLDSRAANSARASSPATTLDPATDHLARYAAEADACPRTDHV